MGPDPCAVDAALVLSRLPHLTAGRRQATATARAPALEDAAAAAAATAMDALDAARSDAAPASTTASAALPAAAPTQAEAASSGATEGASSGAAEVAAGTPPTIDLPTLNPYITCRICSGYFRDAHVITECMHGTRALRNHTDPTDPPPAFCRSCLWKLLREDQRCPTCRTALTASSLATLVKPDRVTQAIVDKILPELAAHDARDEELFYEERRIALKERWVPADSSAAGFSSASAAGRASSSSHGAGTAANGAPGAAAPALDLCFSLWPRARDDAEFDGRALENRFFQTSRRLQIAHVRDHLAEKLGVSRDDIGVACRGVACAPVHTVEFVKRTMWDPDNAYEDLQLEYYRVARGGAAVRAGVA